MPDPSFEDRQGYLFSLIHILIQQQGKPNKIKERCQFIGRVTIYPNLCIKGGFKDSVDIVQQ